MTAVDVVIPAYNAAHFIDRCLASVCSQSHKPANIIAVNDASTDDTLAKLQAWQTRHPAITVLNHEQNQGLPATRNTGLAQVTAPYVAFLDSDDSWLPHKLEKQLALFATAPATTGMVYSHYDLMDAHGQPITDVPRFAPSYRGDIFQPLLEGRVAISASASAALIKTEYLAQSGPFDASLQFAEDWDMWLRLARVCAFDFVAEPCVNICMHPNSMQRKETAGKRARFFYARVQILAKHPESVQQPKAFYKPHHRAMFRLCQAADFAPDAMQQMHDTLQQHGAFGQKLATYLNGGMQWRRKRQRMRQFFKQRYPLAFSRTA